ASQTESIPSPGDSPPSPAVTAPPTGASGEPLFGWNGQVSRPLTNPFPLSPPGRTNVVGSDGADGPWSASRWLPACRKKTLGPGVAGFERGAVPLGDARPDSTMLLLRPQVSVMRLGDGGFSGFAFWRMNVLA